MSLAADGLVSEPPRIIRDHSEEEHAAMKLHRIRVTAYVHRNAVNGIGARAIAVTQTGADGVETAVLRKRPEGAVSILENGRVIVPANGEAWIKRQGTHPPSARSPLARRRWQSFIDNF